MSKLKINNKNLIDLPSYNFGNKLDLFFIKKCKFYIGCDSGPIDTAWLFNKPVLLQICMRCILTHILEVTMIVVF